MLVILVLKAHRSTHSFASKVLCIFINKFLYPMKKEVSLAYKKGKSKVITKIGFFRL